MHHVLEEHAEPCGRIQDTSHYDHKSHMSPIHFRETNDKKKPKEQQKMQSKWSAT